MTPEEEKQFAEQCEKAKTSDLILTLVDHRRVDLQCVRLAAAEIDRRIPVRPSVTFAARKKNFLKRAGGNYPRAICLARESGDERAAKSLENDRENL